MKSVFLLFLVIGFSANATLKEFSVGVKDVKQAHIPSGGDNCVNFSGRWSGACESSGKSESESMSIDQFACDAWFLDSFPDFLYLNGQKVISDTDLAGPDAPYRKEQIFESKWDGDKIIMTISQKNSKSSQPVFSSTGKFELKGSSSSLMIEWNNSKGEHKICTLIK